MPVQTGAPPSEAELAGTAGSTSESATSAASAAATQSSTEPNPENKLFVGGCPPSSAEEELRKVFEAYGTVEEVFIMRGGSRSGMACAFVRYQTQEMAKAAIESIHGQITLENASEPLVVRWADAPGSRRKTNNYRGGGRGGGGGCRDGHGGRDMCGRSGGQMSYMQQQGYGYGSMASQPMQMQMQMHAQAMHGAAYPGVYPQQQMGANYAAIPMGYMPQQHHGVMMNYPNQMGQWPGQPLSPTSPTGTGVPQHMMVHGSMGSPGRVNHMMAAQMHYQQYAHQQYQAAPAGARAAEGLEGFPSSSPRGGGKSNRAAARAAGGAGAVQTGLAAHAPTV